MTKRTLTLIFAMMLSAMSMMAQEDKEQQALELKNEGIELHDQGKYDEAIKKYNQALKLDPTNPNIYYEKALTLQTQGKVSDAKKVLLDALKKCKDYDMTLIYMSLSNIIDDEGDTKKAIELLITASEKDPNMESDIEQRVAYNLGVCYQRLSTQEPDSVEKNLMVALNCFAHSLTLNPQHPGSYFGLYGTMTCPEARSIGMSHLSSALAALGWYAFFGANHPQIESLAEMPDKWLAMNLSQAEVDSLGPCSRAAYQSVCEIAKKEPSEYGRVYDIFMTTIPKVIEIEKDSLKEIVPMSLVHEDPHDTFFYPLFAKMQNDSVFETFCHVVAMRAKKDYIANANWVTKNDAAVQKLLAMLNEGRYFDPDLKEEVTYGKVPEIESVTSAEDAHNHNEEASLACKYYLGHYLDAEGMDKCSKFILSWSTQSPDVNVLLGEEETKWVSETTAPYLVAYMAACSEWLLEHKQKDLDIDGYVYTVGETVQYYGYNKDKTGTNEELDLLLNLLQTDQELFETEVKKHFPQQ